MRVSNLGLYRKTYRNKGQIWRKLRSTVTNTTDLKGGIASEPRDPLSHVNYSSLGKRQQVFTATTPAVLILPKSSAGEIFHSDIKQFPKQNGRKIFLKTTYSGSRCKRIRAMSRVSDAICPKEGSDASGGICAS